MKIYYLGLFGVLFLLFSCTPREHKIIIEGDLYHADVEKIYLYKVSPDNILLIDSAQLKDNRFSITLKGDEEIKEPAYYRLFVDRENTINTIIRGGEHIQLTADARNLVKSYEVSGGQDALLMQQLDHTLKLFIDTVDRLYNFYLYYIESDSARIYVESVYLVLLENHEAYLKTFIDEHQASLATLTAFYQTYNRRRFIDETENVALLKTIYDRLHALYPDNENVTYLGKRIKIIENKRIEKEKPL